MSEKQATINAAKVRPGRRFALPEPATNSAARRAR
jgi:hypothetical protein